MSKNKGERYMVTRSVYKDIKKYDHTQMERFLQRVYMNGYADGRKSVPGLDVKDVLAAVGTIKGIGPATMAKLTDAINQQFGGGESGKENPNGGTE